MPKISALKLLSETLLPTCVVFATKLLVIFLLTIFFGIGWSLATQGSFYKLFFLNFGNQTDLYFVSNWSDIGVTLLVGVWFSWILYQLNHLSQATVPPHVAANLAAKKVSFLIAKEENLYHQIVVWLALSWFTLLLILENFLAGFTSVLVFGFSLAIVVTLTFWSLASTRIFSEIEKIDNDKSS